jgi:hypothetical protein
MNSGNIDKTCEPGNKFIIQYDKYFAYSPTMFTDEISPGFSTYKDIDKLHLQWNFEGL